MDFKTNKPIYQQIVDFSFARIISGEWAPGERVPSVRELSVEMSVNTHTVLKAFDYMQAHEIIYPRRGLGFFLSDNAREKVHAARREDFFEQVLPEVFAEMKMLDVTIDEIVSRYRLLNHDT